MSGQDFANAGQTDGQHAPEHNMTENNFGCIKTEETYLLAICAKEE